MQPTVTYMQAHKNFENLDWVFGKTQCQTIAVLTDYHY